MTKVIPVDCLLVKLISQILLKYVMIINHTRKTFI